MKVRAPIHPAEPSQVQYQATTSSLSQQAASGESDRVRRLYRNALPSTRSGPLFLAHSYPTKIDSTAVMACILAHTQPGDLVFDGFAGSGVTGLAAKLCGRPDESAKTRIESLLGQVAWGERNAVLYDLSTLAVFISHTLLDPPPPEQFTAAAQEVLRALNADWGWLYAAQNHGAGSIRYTLWTDFPVCPHCGHSDSFWNLGVTVLPPSIAQIVTCSACHQTFDVTLAERETEMYWDDLLNRQALRRGREPVLMYGRSGKSLWKRQVSPEDLELVHRVNQTPVPQAVPIVPMLGSANGRWGEMYRAGYHTGVTHLHHFYTRRNLIAVAAAWEMADSYPQPLRQALKFWISSYNAMHCTLMTRVVVKKAAKDFVVTGAQPGALYISSLPVEKNVFVGLERKLNTVTQAFQTLHGSSGCTLVCHGSSLHVHLPDESVDYIFTDPPFGQNIQYSEVNFISEAWLGQPTVQEEEAIVSHYQGKSIEDYQALLAGAFVEAYRILKTGRYMTVAFHSTQPEIWSALRTAWGLAGFKLVGASVLDKKQGSFKQTTTEGAVKGDPLILLKKPFPEETTDTPPPSEGTNDLDPWQVVAERLQTIEELGLDNSERSRQRLYSRLIIHYLERRQPVPIDARRFFHGLKERFECRNGLYYLNHHGQ